jgi:hypothetical protein
MNAIEQLKSVLCDHTGKCSIIGSDEDCATVDRALQALAAPVQPVAWADAYAISNLPAVDEAIRALLDDKTADNATAVVQAILGATPPEQPTPVQEPCRECAGEGIQGEDGDGFVLGVTWRCDSCNGTGKSTPPAAPVQPAKAPKEYTMGNWFNDLENPHGNR